MAAVFAIEEFATFDGPGIRTTVFFKGCPLKCSWCHNPEGQNPKPEYVRAPSGCTQCGACLRASKAADGSLDENSADACPRNLVRLCGTDYTVEALENKIMKNAEILKSNGGGVTFSGGEPLYDGKFLAEIMGRLKGRIHIALQTCGYASAEVFDKILPLADYVLYDLKVMSKEKAKRYLGVDNAPILRNYETLCKSKKQFVTRVPLIPQVTDTTENLTGIAEFMKKNGVRYVETLPYNKMAGSKYPLVMRSYSPDFDPDRQINDGAEIFAAYGIQSKMM